MTLYDRKNNFNKKYLSLCEKNCIYKGYNKVNKTANCECKTKTEFPKFTTQKVDLLNLLYRFLEENKKFTNFFVLTCTNELFSSKGFKTNFGSYFNIGIFALIIYFGIVFFLKRYHPLLTKIENLNSKVYSNESAKVVDNYTALGLNGNPSQGTENNNSNSKPTNNGLIINNLVNSEAKNVDKKKQWSF